MTEHYRQNKSSFRTGEPADHLAAKEYIGTLLKWSGWNIHYEYPLVDPMMGGSYKHNYDIVAFNRVMVIEIDDPNLHSKPKKKINDKIAEYHVKTLFPRHTVFLRLNKDEINNHETLDEYLSGNFWPYIH